ncbi:MAG TPA: penicillin-binding protein 2 [Mycobacteriales bacterium]|nr:penicillin-binding protein 2 [Mycobacteriales bacterium]
MLLILGGRLVQLQGVDSGRYAAAAVSDRIHEYDLPALRGQILDRDGNVLAYSADAQLIFADPSQVTKPHTTAAALSPLLGMPASRIYPKLIKPGKYVELLRGVDPDRANRIMALDLRGIGANPQQRRIDPAGSVGAALVGFTNRAGHGASGVEARFDSLLAGRNGTLVAETGKNGQVIPNGVHHQVAAVPGSSVRLTVSEDLQYVTQRALNDAVHAVGAQGGEVAVLDAHTAQVLALAVSPSQHGGQPLLTDPAVSGVFEPGSANKIVTFSGAVQEGLIQPDTVLKVPGSIRFADRIIHDAWSHGVVPYTATGVLAKSSNVGTLMIAQQLGQQRFYDYMRRFGLGTRTGVELPAESPGILPPISQWSGSTFGNLPIGQGVSMTILQLASMYQTVANDGVRVPPRIVRSVTGPDGRARPSATPRGVRVVSPKTAQTVRYMMEAVTQKRATAPSAAIDGYVVAGKTGTAQKPDPRCGCYTDHYWATFAGMAPADDPQIVIAIMINDASGGQHGGQAAAPLFRQVMTYALKQRGVPPSGASRPTFRLIAD